MKQAVKEAGLEVVAQPKIDVTSMEKVKTGLSLLKLLQNLKLNWATTKPWKYQLM